MSTETPPVAPPTPPVAPPVSGVGDHWAKSWIGQDFTLNHSALEKLPDHLKGMRPTLEKYKGFEDVLVGFQNQQVMAGKKALAPLPPDAPDTVKAERKALLDTINGVPADVKAYGIARPDDLPEQFWDGKLAEGFAAWAHKHSVSPAAAKELLGIQIAGVRENLQSQQQFEQKFFADQQKAFEDQIKQDNIPADKANALVEKGAMSLGLDPKNPDHETLLKNANVRLMAMRHAISTSEDTFVQGGNSNTKEGDPSQLASDAVHNPANPLYAVYWNREGKYTRDQQNAAITKVNEWHRQAAATSGRGRR